MSDQWLELPYSALGSIPVVANEASLPANPIQGTIVLALSELTINVWTGAAWKKVTIA